jgi:hypothetical protein
MSEQDMRVFDAAQQVGAAYNCIRDNPSIAAFYRETVRVPLTPAAALADQAMLRSWIDFLDEEIVEITRPHVPAVLQHRLVANYRVACDMTGQAAPVPMEVDVRGLDVD